MSKPYYETEEYSEAENELDTYDDKVKLVMEYRLSEKHKDQQIAELKAENERLKKYETIYYMNQLQASNEVINKFKQNEFQQCINIFELLKDNTKQVCEKIRKKFPMPKDEIPDEITYSLNEFLDKIERGTDD